MMRILVASRFLLFALLAILMPAQAQESSPGDHLISWENQQRFLLGANTPWQNGGFSADFGTVEEWKQHTYSHEDTETMYKALQETGASTVRWWIFADGRGAPEFDSSSGGNVIGLDADFLPSLEDAIQLAARHEIYLVLNLWSFDMLMPDGTPDNHGEHGGGHADLIQDQEKLQSFIDNALLPILTHPIDGTDHTIGTHPNVMAWDIINEPEWGIVETPPSEGITQPVSLNEMQRFVASIASTIHKNSTQLVTVGSASIKWNCDNPNVCVANWWSDEALTQYDSQGYLDFYSPHYYEWMDGNCPSSSFSPLCWGWLDAYNGSKPVVIGEFAANTGRTKEILMVLEDHLFAGAWVWSYEEAGKGSWADTSDSFKEFNIER